MAEQSFLAKLGLRLGVVGSAAALAIAAPIANADYSTTAGTAANRTGIYFDQTAAAEKIGFVVGGQTGPIFTRNGAVVDALFTGQLTIGDGTTNANLRINGAAATARSLFYQTAGVNRWEVGANNTAEGGADAGSDYVIKAYTDAGALIDTPMTIVRAAGGAITYSRIVTITTGTVSANLVLLANAGVAKSMFFQTAGSNRWQYTCDATAESGSNSGSNFALNAYDDTGVLIDQPITIIRAALGATTVNRPFQIAAGTVTTAINAFITAVTWNNAAVAFSAFVINVTDTASASGAMLWDLQVASTTRFNIRKQGLVVSTIVDTDFLGTLYGYNLTRTATITGNVTDGLLGLSVVPVVNGVFTVTRLNYIALGNVSGTSTITDGCAMRFNAAAGTHKCVDAATTKTSPGTVSAWLKHNLNGSIVFQPLYTSKTS